MLAVNNKVEQQRVIDYLNDSSSSVNKFKQRVDFSVSDIQRLSDGFMLASATQEKHLTGIKFSGRIINTQSVDSHNVTFNLTVNGKTKKFTINKISSGNSTGFNVYIPDLSAENARYAEIKYVSSSIAFLTK